MHCVAPVGHYPLKMRLHLPDSWLMDSARPGRRPRVARRQRGEERIALESLDQARPEGLPGQVVVADAGYGVVGPFRDGLAERGLHYVIGVGDEMGVLTDRSRWVEQRAATGGRPQERPRLSDDSPRPVSLKALAERTPRQKLTWREGTKGPMRGCFGWLRVLPAGGGPWLSAPGPSRSGC